MVVELKMGAMLVEERARLPVGACCCGTAVWVF